MYVHGRQIIFRLKDSSSVESVASESLWQLDTLFWSDRAMVEW